MEGQDRVLHFIPGQFTGDAKSSEIRFPEEIESATLLIYWVRKGYYGRMRRRYNDTQRWRSWPSW